MSFSVAEETSLLAEARIVVGTVLQYMLQMCMMQAASRFSLAFVGHYEVDASSVAAASLGSMYSSITGLSLGMGMALPMGSLCSQNLGRGEPHENGAAMKNCLRAHSFCFVFALLAAAFAVPILDSLGQPKSLLEPVRSFSLVMVLGWPATWAFASLNHTLASQRLQWPGVIGQAASSMLNLLLSWQLLAHGVGFLGVAIAAVVAAWTGLAFLVLFVVLTQRQGMVWKSPTKVWTYGEELASFCEYLRTAIPIASAMWIEWWAAEVLALFAGWLPCGENCVAANGILFNTMAVAYMAFVAVSRACMLRVGFKVGRRDIVGIRMSILVCLVVTLLLSCTVALGLDLGRSAILTTFTTHSGILQQANAAYLGLVFSIPPYSIMMCLNGALLSAKLQGFVARAMLVAFYAVGLPFGYVSGVLSGGGLLGVWEGNVVALTSGALLVGARMCCTDWESVVENSSSVDARNAAVTALRRPMLQQSQLEDKLRACSCA